MRHRGLRVTIRHALEAPIEKRVAADALEKLGVVSLKLTLRYDAGWPDRFFLIPGGRPLFIEFKRPGDLPRALQEQRHATLRKLGYQTEVCDDYEDAMRLIEQARENAINEALRTRKRR